MNVAANTDVPIVCLGASAGGLEACQEFFGSMSVDTGAAFVVVVHLSPDFKSLMPELIRKCTNMPVSTAEDGTTLLADRVYMIPPGANMLVKQGRLKLEAQDRRPGHALHLPIDLFMVSMAREHTSLCISVILSGTGSDGSRGVRAVKEAGGVVLVQTRDSARFDGMPVSACQTGVVDAVGTPKELAVRVAHILGDERIQEDETRAENSQLQRVFELLSEGGGLDLSYLRPNMVMRRIRRRMTLAGHRSFEDYLEALAEHGDERTHLGNDLLIGVTRFNRDSGAFQGLLTRVLPKILLNLGAKEPCRVWVAGCSTGQEVYTVSMALQEAMIGSGIRRDTRIFATDVSESSLVRASRGAYTLSDVADLPHSWQLKYMEQEAERFVVRSDIRRSVIFARHNLVVDAPFTRIDLVTCRNLLIYLRPELQERVLGSLYLSLKPDHGYLMLGSAEDVGSLSSSLVAVDKSAKIFLRSGPPPHNLSQRKFLREPISVIKTGVPISTMRGDQPRAQWRYAALEVLAEADRRSVAIVQAPHRLVEVITDPLEIFGLRKGPPTDDLTRMLPPAVCTALSAANRRLDDGEGHVHLVSPSLNGTEFVVTLRNLPAKLGDGRFRTLLVQSRPSEPETFSPETIATSSTQRVGELERDLRETKESLQATIEELQAASEEQQSTNEELVASNEELQSTNEELHSVNEELFTVNAEYRQRNEELQLVTADLDNLLRSISVATIYLDTDLRLRRYTPSVVHLLPLQESDIGRPITDFSHSLQVDLAEVSSQVQSSGEMHEQEVRDRLGSWLLLRALPYKEQGKERRMAGVLITLVDVTRIKNAEQAARVMADQLQESNTQLSEQSIQLEDFFSIVAHDVKRPMLTLDGMLNLARNCAEELDQNGTFVHLDKASEALLRLRNLFADLTALSKQSTVFIEQEEVELRPWLEELLDPFTQRANKESVELRWAVSGKSAVFSRAAASGILTNLVENALVHGTTNPEPCIDIVCQTDPSTVRFSVSDNGQGIATKDQSKVFELFRRLNPDSSAGSGVGLVAARRLAAKAGGTVHLESELGRGATFVLELPSGSVGQAPMASGQPESGQNILLVEDDAADAKYVKEALSGYKIVTATTLEDARRRTAARVYDAIVLDLSLPDGHGLSLLSPDRIGVNGKTPVVVLSGHGAGIFEETASGSGGFATVDRLTIVDKNTGDALKIRHIVSEQIGEPP